MKFSKGAIKKAIKEELTADNGDVIQVLEKLLDAIDGLDTSIDYLAAKVTGSDPLTIQLRQRALGRLAVPGAGGSGKLDEAAAIMRVKEADLIEMIQQEIKEIIDLPSDLSTPMGPEEQRMEILSRRWQKLINDEIWLNVEILDPVDGEKKQLDEFIAILGNYVVSDEVDEGAANDLAKEIAHHVSSTSFEPNPHDWGTPLPKWEDMPGFEPQDELQEGGRAGHLEPEDAILKALQNVVEAWGPETPEGEKYEADILDLLARFEEPLRLSAPAQRDIDRLAYGARTGRWREKRSWEK